jgi:hypothetical protein
VDWVNVGLVCDIAGAAVLAWGLLIDEDEALELGQARISGDTREENLELPAVRDRLRQSRNAKWGLAFLVLGFALQIAASWPT